MVPIGPSHIDNFMQVDAGLFNALASVMLLAPIRIHQLLCVKRALAFGEYNSWRDKILQPYAHYLTVDRLARSFPCSEQALQANGCVSSRKPSGQNEALPALSY